MEKKHLLLFDFDGVIVDSFEAAYETAEKVLPGLTRETYRGFFARNIYSAVEDEGSSKEKPHAEDSYFKHYKPKLAGLAPVPGMSEAIQTLSNQFHCVIISSGLTSFIQQFLKKFGLLDCFHSVFGADVDTSKERKIRTTIASFDLPASSCIFITDTVGDIREAAQVDVPSVAVSWGYHATKDLLAEKPRAVVLTPAALVAEIQKAFTVKIED